MKISTTQNYTYNPNLYAGKNKPESKNTKTTGLSQNASEIAKSQKNSIEPVSHAPIENQGVFDYIRAHFLNSAGIYDEDGEQTLKLYEKMKDEKTVSNSIENFARTTDNKGYRGSSVFSARGKKNIKNLKNLGVERIIDLRSDGPYEYCNNICKKAHLEYFKYPIKWGEEKWEQSDIDGLVDLVKELRKGNYYIGCALGSHRTDAALSIAFCLDKNAKKVPKLISGKTPTKMRTIMCKIFGTINEICYTNDKKNPRLNDDFVKQLGWKNLSEFLQELPKRKAAIENLNGTILKSVKL